MLYCCQIYEFHNGPGLRERDGRISAAMTRLLVGSDKAIKHMTQSASTATKPAAKSGSSAQQVDAEARVAIGRSRAIAASLGAIVSIMMRSKEYRNTKLADIEWIVGPALSADQVAIAEARDPKIGVVAPVAALLWATVSPAVDQRLSNTADATPRLEPKDWRSGDIPWIIAAIGDKRALSALMDQVIKQRFPKTPPKMRVRDKDGKAKVGHVNTSARGPAA